MGNTNSREAYQKTVNKTVPIKNIRLCADRGRAWKKLSEKFDQDQGKHVFENEENQSDFTDGFSRGYVRFARPLHDILQQSAFLTGSSSSSSSLAGVCPRREVMEEKPFQASQQQTG